MDIYAKPIQLTYQGRDTFKTSFGGVVSTLVMMLFLSMAFYKLNDMIHKNLTVVKKNSLVSISNSYVPPEDISEKNINFAFMLSDFYAETIFDNDYYGKFYLQQLEIYIRQNEDGSTYRQFISNQIPFSKCAVGVNFRYPNEEEVAMYNIGSYFCPEWQNLTLQGNWYSPEYKLINLQFKRCSGQSCASDDEIKTWLKNKWIQQIFISSNFDIKDYERPIQFYLDDSYQAIEFQSTAFNTVYYKKDVLKLNDDLFGFFDGTEEKSFYQISHSKQFVSNDQSGPGEGVLYYQDIKLDKEYDIYERQVYSVSSLLQDIGGFYNSLFFIGLILFSKFQESIYFSSLISKLYQIDGSLSRNYKKFGIKKSQEQENKPADLNYSMRSDKNLQLQLPSSSIQLSQESMSSMQGSQQLSRENLGKQLIRDIQQGDWKISKNIADSIVGYLSDRTSFEINLRDILTITIKRYLGCRCFKQRSKQPINKTLNQKRLKLYFKGKEKIQKELDAVQIIKKLRLLNEFLDLKLSKEQKILASQSKKNLLVDYNSDSEEEENMLVFEKLNLNQQTKRSSRRQSKILFMNEKNKHSIEKAFNYLQRQQNMRSLDKKIILNILTNNRFTQQMNLIGSARSLAISKQLSSQDVKAKYLKNQTLGKISKKSKQAMSKQNSKNDLDTLLNQTDQKVKSPKRSVTKVLKLNTPMRNKNNSSIFLSTLKNRQTNFSSPAINEVIIEDLENLQKQIQ
eukprot:403366865